MSGNITTMAREPTLVSVAAPMHDEESTVEAFHARVSAALEHVRFEGAPRFLGIDEQGREILSYVEGVAPIAPYPGWAHEDGVLAGVARTKPYRVAFDFGTSLDARTITSSSTRSLTLRASKFAAATSSLKTSPG